MLTLPFLWFVPLRVVCGCFLVFIKNFLFAFCFLLDLHLSQTNEICFRKVHLVFELCSQAEYYPREILRFYLFATEKLEGTHFSEYFPSYQRHE